MTTFKYIMSKRNKTAAAFELIRWLYFFVFVL